MWMQKLSDGVLRVLTPLGPRYIRPTFLQRIYILWIFRHFHVLPLQVLSGRQRALIESLCAQQRFVSLSPTDEFEYAPILGTVERRPPVEVENCRRENRALELPKPSLRWSRMFGRGLKAERRFLHIVTSSFDSIAAHVGAAALTPHLKSTQIFLSDRTDGSTGTPDA